MEPKELTEYERQRLKNMKRNNEMLASLGVHSTLNQRQVMAPSKRHRGMTIMDTLQSQASSQSLSEPPQQLQPLSHNSRSRGNIQLQLPLSQPLQLPLTHNTRSRVRTQSQTPLQLEVPQLHESDSTQQNGTFPSESSSTKRVRGVAKGIDTWGTGKKLHIDFNEFMQPYGENQQQLATQLGIIARNGEKVPLIYAQWNDMPQDILDYIWKEVEDNIDAPPEYRKNCLQSVGECWRKWKSRVKQDYYEIWETDEQRLSYWPRRVIRDQWETLIAYWGTEKQQVISAKNKKNRQFQELNHRTGRTPHVQIRAKMEANGDDTSRISIFKKTRTPKNGEPMNSESQDIVKEMERERDALPEEERTPEVLDKIFTKFIGPDGHGRVKTYGLGVTPQVVFGNGKGLDQENKLKKIREEITAEYNAKLEKRDEEMNAQFNMRLAEMRNTIRDEILAELRGSPACTRNVHTTSSVHRPNYEGEDSFSREDINEEE